MKKNYKTLYLKSYKDLRKTKKQLKELQNMYHSERKMNIAEKIASYDKWDGTRNAFELYGNHSLDELVSIWDTLVLSKWEDYYINLGNF